jgi:amino acid adenylation domain-containing protein
MLARPRTASSLDACDLINMQKEIFHSIPQRFQDVVRQSPEQFAVKMGERTWTYQSLNRQANRIAHAIMTTRGQGSEPIALLFEQGVDFIAAILGVLKAGKFFVALDSSLPKARIQHILRDAGTPLIVSNDRHSAFAAEFAGNGIAFCNTDQIDPEILDENIDLHIPPTILASLVYTSGSTGTPKGVTETHQNVLESASINSSRECISSADKLTLLHSLTFASGRINLFLALSNGASLFPFDARVAGPTQLEEWLRTEEITVLHCPVALFRELADSLSGPGCLPSLRMIHLSGAPITALDFDRYRKRFGSNTLLDITMGSTEARSIGAAIVDRRFSFPSEGAPVGYAAPGKKLLILDENNHEVPPGEAGQIAVKGRNLNPGYWKNPGLNNNKYLPDPDGTDEQIYLTGDVGRLLPDGFLIHLGRKDTMIKIRGYRIDLTEIERALLRQPQVSEAGIAAWARDDGEKYLAAYVVPRAQPGPTVAALRAFLRQVLPTYMMPAAFVFLSSLPKTNGKLDRTALPLPDDKRPDLGQAYVQPQGKIQEFLAEVWEKVLNVRPIGIHDDFFDLGGHSLAASRVVSQVIKHFQLLMPLQSLFEAPTIARMAALITAHQGNRLKDDELERILDELASLSDDEAQRMLATANNQRSDDSPAQ